MGSNINKLYLYNFKKDFDESKINRSQSSYEEEARKLANKFASPYIAKAIIMDDYYMSILVSQLMVADATFDESKNVKQSSYRVLTARHTIGHITQEIITNKNKCTNVTNEFIDNNVAVDNKSYKSEFLRNCFKNKSLSKRDKRIMYMRFYENKNFREIADKLDISKQRVEQLLKNICNTLRYVAIKESYFE